MTRLSHRLSRLEREQRPPDRRQPDTGITPAEAVEALRRLHGAQANDRLADRAMRKARKVLGL